MIALRTSVCRSFVSLLISRVIQVRARVAVRLTARLAARGQPFGTAASSRCTLLTCRRSIWISISLAIVFHHEGHEEHEGRNKRKDLLSSLSLLRVLRVLRGAIFLSHPQGEYPFVLRDNFAQRPDFLIRPFPPGELYVIAAGIQLAGRNPVQVVIQH